MPVSEQAWGSLSCPQPGEVAGVWPWGVSRNQAGELTIGQFSVPDLANQYGASFRFLDLDDLVSRATVNSFAWAEEFWNGYGFAGVDICFPVRLCPIPEALRALVDLGFKLRVYSSEELVLLDGLDISFTNVVFELSDSNSPAAAKFISAGGTELVFSSMKTVKSLRNLLSGCSANFQTIWQLPVTELVRLSENNNDFINEFKSLSGVSSVTLSGIEIDCAQLAEDYSSMKNALAGLLELRHTLLDNDLGLPSVGMLLNGQVQKYAGNQIVVEPVDLARELANCLRQSCDIMGDEVPRFGVTIGQWLVSPSVFSVCEVIELERISGETEVAQAALVVSDFGVFPRFWLNSETGFAYRGVVLANRVSAEPVVACKCFGESFLEDFYLLAPEDVRVGDLLVCPIGDFAQSCSEMSTVVDIVLWRGQVLKLEN